MKNNDILTTLVSQYVTDLHAYIIKYKDQILLSVKLQTIDNIKHVDTFTYRLRNSYKVPKLLTSVIDLKHSDETKIYLNLVDLCANLLERSIEHYPEVWTFDKSNNTKLGIATSGLAGLILLTHFLGITMYNSETLKSFLPLLTQLHTLSDTELSHGLTISLRNAGNLVFSLLKDGHINMTIN